MMRSMLIACLLFVSAPLFVRAQDSLLKTCAASNGGSRPCLGHMLDIYLKSLLVHKTDELPLASNVKFTEDGVEKKLGDGLWKTISQIRPDPQAFIDVRQGVAATLAVVEENGVRALLVIRLKVAGGKITEVETM